jgi:hypothetical protein
MLGRVGARCGCGRLFWAPLATPAMHKTAVKTAARREKQRNLLVMDQVEVRIAELVTI